MKKSVFSALTLVLSVTAQAQQKPVDLAVETYKFMETGEMKLQGAVNGRVSEGDYNRFIWQPALDQFHQWPSLGNEAFSKYRPCQFAVDAFRVYSEDQFGASGQMDKNRPSYKDYFSKKKECAALLKGKV